MSIGLSSGGTHGFYLSMMGIIGPKVRGARAKLLGKDRLRAVIFAESLDDALGVLRDTIYRSAVEKISKETSPEEVTKEFKTVVIQNLVSLAASCPMQARNLLVAYLMKFEIENIKVVAKCLHEGKERRDIERLVNTYIAEILGRRHVLTYILGARDLEDLGTKLRELFHPAAEVFEHIVRLVKSRPQLATCIIDTMLDRVYISRLYTVTTSILMHDNSATEAVNAIADFYNISLLLRARLWNLPLDVVQNFYVPYGNVGKNFTRLYSEPIVRVLEELSTNPMISALQTMVKVTELEQVVPKLSLAQYKAAYTVASSIISRYSAASPGAALMIAHVQDLEAELVTAVIRCFMEGVSKSLIRSHFGLVL